MNTTEIIMIVKQAGKQFDSVMAVLSDKDYAAGYHKAIEDVVKLFNNGGANPDAEPLEAKEFLRQVEKIDLRIKNKLVEQQQWRDVALGITANIGSDKVQSSGVKSKMAEAIDKCIDMESEINNTIDHLIAIKREVISIIEQLDNPTEYNLLHLRYIQHIELQDIADRYGKEYGWVTTCHGRALKSVQNILDKLRSL